MGRPAVALLLVLCACISCLGASEALLNDTGTVATGVVVAFSGAVKITGYDDSVFGEVSPAALSTRFIFSGGKMLASRRFSISWSPSWAAIESVEWRTREPQSSTPTWQSTILGDVEPGAMPIIQDWSDLSRLYYGALTLSTNSWTPTDAEYVGFERSDWQTLRLRGALSTEGVVFRIEFPSAGRPSRDPAVEYEISLGRFGAVLVTCDETGASIWTSVHEPKIPLGHYTVQRDAITVALTVKNLEAIGCAPLSLLGLDGRLGVKYRTDKIHYFIYYDGESAGLSWVSSIPRP